MAKDTLSLNKGGDERIKIGGAPDVRGDRGVNDEIEPDQRISTDDEFEKFLEDEFTQTALPNPPALQGYHLAWLTTTSQYDSVQKRQRLGYTPVRQSEMPGFDASNGQSLAGYDGYVNCNEMVLFKIPMDRYQQIMAFYHHKKPLQEEEGIVGKFNEQGQRLGDQDDGIDAMEREMNAKRNKVPTFS